MANKTQIAIRNALENYIDPQNADHPGLYFDRYLKEQNKAGEPISEDASAFSKHLKNVANIKGNKDAYKQYFHRWHVALRQLADTSCYLCTISGRMIIGLGNESVTETGLTLHHTYGVPYIPGSALKGLTAHFTSNSITFNGAQDQQVRKILFGSSDESGFITFHDALPDPADFDIIEDIMTPHHQKYYSGENISPGDFDSPVPISFLSVHGTFHVALTGPEAWRKCSKELLTEAIQQEGIGAKTSSGYGRGTIANCSIK